MIEWANTEDRGIGPYTTKSMEETTFFDLDLELGKSYLYMHQGDCEHIFIISDIR